MKKVIILVLLVMLASTVLMASGPTLRLLKLTIINKSGNEICLRLTGSDLGKQFYYLCVPAGTKTSPYVKVFTVLEDIYTRVTYVGMGSNIACIGSVSTGQLIMDHNVRLTFTPCFSIPSRFHYSSYGSIENCIANNFKLGCYIPLMGVRDVNNGEPGMEKVVFFYRLELKPYADKYYLDTEATGDVFHTNVYWKRGCGFNDYFWYIQPYRVPSRLFVRGLCQWRYQYDRVRGYDL